MSERCSVLTIDGWPQVVVMIIGATVFGRDLRNDAMLRAMGDVSD